MLKEVAPRRLLPSFVANVTHLMPVSLWVGGVLALLAELPQLAVLPPVVGRTARLHLPAWGCRGALLQHESPTRLDRADTR